jgi:WASH complex subunit strumpellin
MFIEEFDRLITTYITMECMYLLTKKRTVEELSYDEDIPMPNLKSEPAGCVNFMGRLFR